MLAHLFFLPQRAFAAVFNGGGLNEGLGHASGISGPANADLRSVITNVLLAVLNFLALAAVVFIIIAGIYLVVSAGREESKEKAKKIILYVIIGLIVILFARMIVGFFLNINNLGP